MQEELSPDAQLRLIREYCDRHNYILPEEYIFMDIGISGKKAEKRNDFMRMISLAKQKQGSPFEAILVWKFNRFARNQEESIVYKSMLRNKCNVDVISITQTITEDIYGGLIERIIEWTDEFYSIQLAEDVTRGMTENALRGNFQASPALGYRVIQKGVPPVVDEDQAAVVRTIFKLYTSSTMGFYEIARHLNSLGYKTRNKREFEARGIKYILQNPIYKGYLRWNYSDSSNKEIKPESEWIIRKGNIKPIVSEEIWALANDRINTEYRPRGGKPITQKRHWLSGLIKCSSCGASLSTSVHRDKRYGRIYTNFQCYRYVKGKCLVSHGISEKKLVPLVLSALEEDMNKSSIECEYIPPESVTNDLDILKAQLKKLDAKEDRIKEAYQSGIDTLEEYKENKLKLKKDREKLLAEIQKQEEQKPEVIDMPDRIRGVYNILTSDQCNKDEKYAAIRSIVKKIVFDRENKLIDIYYYTSV